MIVANILPLLLLALIVWIVASRRKTGRRAARGLASSDMIPYPSRQLDAGLSHPFASGGTARSLPQPSRWVVCGLVVALLALATLEFVLRYLSPMPGVWGLGYFAMLVLSGVFMLAIKLPAYSLGQPRKADGTAPRGSGILSVIVLAVLTNGAVQSAKRILDYNTSDTLMMEDTINIVFAGLLVLALIGAVLRLLLERSET